MIVSKLKQFLVGLEVRESAKPKDARRKVPSLSDISRGTGISYPSISKLANNRAKRLDLNSAEKIIRYVRSLGFLMRVSDLIEFEEATL